MVVSTYNNTRRNDLRYVLKRHTLLSLISIICMLSLNLSIFEFNNNNYGFHYNKRYFKSLAEGSSEEHTNLRSHSTSDPKNNEEKPSSHEMNKCDMKKYTAEEINELIDNSNESISRNDMHIIFSFVHDSEIEKFKKVEENVFKFIESIAETYKIPDDFKMKKFKYAHLEMEGYLIKQEKFLLQYAFLSLNGNVCERKHFKEVLKYVKREWAEFRKMMFELWKEKLTSEFREHGEMLNQKRKLKQHELDRRAQREKMLEEHSRGIFAKGYLGEVESETIKKETEHHKNVCEDNAEKSQKQKIENKKITVEEVKFEEPKSQQQKVEPPKLQQQKVEPPKVQQQKVEPPKVQQQKVKPPKVQQQKNKNEKGQKQVCSKVKGNNLKKK
ncbi:Plasmodium exported protein (PHISTc), unknown function [Plasmodium reichenowi]|uniref:Plasmodium RESA N-terminal domain-containing protein n=1 Tax=Plasmodium reichenowi TaxID=5854 RepID=A0A060RST4_PLARE|nr:Plasmodium exported protein (PHISTc), unknown function [Plasmodium reichenowi]